MQRQDYILRQIEMMGQILVRLRNMILGRTTSSDIVHAELQAAGRSLGVEFDLARVVSPETLLALLSPSGSIEPGKCWFLAESFYLMGLEAHLSGQNDVALDSLARARLLFDAFDFGTLGLANIPESAERIDEIDRILEQMMS
jgi:hypothetical protein